jgi:hypothetical protein
MSRSVISVVRRYLKSYVVKMALLLRSSALRRFSRVSTFKSTRSTLRSLRRSKKRYRHKPNRYSVKYNKKLLLQRRFRDKRLLLVLLLQGRPKLVKKRWTMRLN